MLEHLIFSELWTKLDASANDIFDYSPTPTVALYRSDQLIENFAYPTLFIGFLDPVVDALNTSLNEIMSIRLVDASGNDASGNDPSANIDYTKGVVVRQSIDFLLYDNDIRRIAALQNQLFLWLKQHLALTNVTIFNISPPLALDFTEDTYVYKRNIEVVCKYAMSWSELAYTIEEMEYELNA